MRRVTLTLALSILPLFAVGSFASIAHADVAPRCKCGTPGIEQQGGLAAVMAIASASALLVGRARRKRG